MDDTINEFDSSYQRSPLKAVNNNKKAKNGPAIEEIYQKKSQLEHILLRPDTYIGSVEREQKQMWVFDNDKGMVLREVSYVPGLYKIFDEILVNAADNKIRDPEMTRIKIDICSEKNEISIYNNGKGIPVTMHKDEKMYVPTMIFGHLLTSSNYDDNQKKVVGGRNGYGAKLCNIFSTKFKVETSSKDFNKSFSQVWRDNMQVAEEPVIGSAVQPDFTRITFSADLSKFKMKHLDKDIVALFSRRAYDVAGSSKGISVFLNGEKLPVRGFLQYIDLFTKGKKDDHDEPLKIAHEVVNNRWEIGVTLSDKGFQQNSFVNSIATTRGGKHVDYVTDQITTKLLELTKKKSGKSTVAPKPFQLKNHVWVFVNCLIENPTFDSQTKETMTLQSKNFGSKCEPSEKFYAALGKVGIVESILSWIKFKEQTDLNKMCNKTKRNRINIPKLDDALDAGSKNSLDCTLILTEGDSAKSLVNSGFGVVGRERYGCFPLRGKMLNVREASHKQIMENSEINSIVKILGLQYGKKYNTMQDMAHLRYGKLMIMTDQDQDGSHIKGLLINFIHHNWPSLMKMNFLEEFITPIVKASKGHQVFSFYSLPEFEEWKTQTPNYNSFKIKYYKGLGTSSSTEAKEYFSNMRRHRIKFKYEDNEDDKAVELAFSKKMIEARKDWLTRGMEERRARRQAGEKEIYLYESSTTHVSFKDFINKELILFSNMDNERSIPSLVDGLKPGQRKVIFTCFKKYNKKGEIKVAQLAGAVGEHSAYHHGEASLMATIINLAQNFVGSNNINLLQPFGQFGTRLLGGKDAASPRYIFTALSPLTRKLFPAEDEPLLNFLYDDNLRIEPEYYVPIIPMVLINGAEGIGTGWSTKVPNYNPRDLVDNIKRLLNDQEIKPLEPWYKGFRGTIVKVDPQRYIINGELAVLDEKTIEITELPIRTWTTSYKESVLEPLMNVGDKTQSLITDYKEFSTDVTVRFLVSLPPNNLRKLLNDGIHKELKIQTPMSTTSMVLFDHNGILKRYETAEDILREYFPVRLRFYVNRKKYYEGVLEAEALKISNQARFILEKNAKKIVMENIKKADFIKVLIERNYDPDPVDAWKKRNNIVEEETERQSDEEISVAEMNFGYLIDMRMSKMLRENVDDLTKQRDAKLKQLDDLRNSTPQQLWERDLDAFLEELAKVEAKEIEDANKHFSKSGLVSKKSKTTFGRHISTASFKPSEDGERIDPKIDYEKYKVKEKKVRKPKMTKEEKDKEDKNQMKITALISTGVAVAATAKTNSTDDDNCDDDDDDIQFISQSLPSVERPKLKMKQSTLNFRPIKRVSEDSSDDNETTKAAKQAKTTFKTTKSDSGKAQVKAPKEKKNEKKAIADKKKKSENKKRLSSDSGEDEIIAKKPAKKAKIAIDSEEEEEIIAKKPAQKAKKIAMDSDSEDEIIAKKPAKKGKIIAIDSDSESDVSIVADQKHSDDDGDEEKIVKKRSCARKILNYKPAILSDEDDTTFNDRDDDTVDLDELLESEQSI